jgi:hypothetical protein
LKKFHTSVATKISFKETTRNIKKGKKKRSFFKFLYGTIPSPNSFAPLKKIGEKEALFARFFLVFKKKRKNFPGFSNVVVLCTGEPIYVKPCLKKIIQKMQKNNTDAAN